MLNLHYSLLRASWKIDMFVQMSSLVKKELQKLFITTIAHCAREEIELCVEIIIDFCHVCESGEVEDEVEDFIIKC
jgi:hypothetical protein